MGLSGANLDLVRWSMVAIWLTTTSYDASAQPVGASGGKEVVMLPPDRFGDGLPQIVGGKEQLAKDWPATLRFLVNDVFYCTSTIISPRVIVTAGHCLVEDAKVRIEFSKDTKDSFSLTCEHHPQYRFIDLFADIAMCLSERDLPTSFPYENLDMRVSRVRKGMQVFLLGYGCRAYPSENPKGPSGQLYGGSAPVTTLSSRSDDHFRTNGDVGICPGDSGGAAYVLRKIDTPDSPRSIIGINSGYIAVGRVSALTALFGEVGQFIRDWSDDNNVRVCGVHSDAQNCREKFTP